MVAIVITSQICTIIVEGRIVITCKISTIIDEGKNFMTTGTHEPQATSTNLKITFQISNYFITALESHQN